MSASSQPQHILLGEYEIDGKNRELYMLVIPDQMWEDLTAWWWWWWWCSSVRSFQSVDAHRSGKLPRHPHRADRPTIRPLSIKYLGPSASTAFTAFGWGAPTAVGTVSTPAIASGGMMMQASRTIVTSATTANSAAEIRSAMTNCWRGDSATVGGFHLVTTFGMQSTTADQRLAVGLFGTTAAIATTQNPSSLTSCVFAGWDSADTSLQIMHNDTTSVCTKVALGANFPVNEPAAVYQLDLFAPPGASYIGWRVKRLDTNNTAEGTITTDLPLSAQTLVYHLYANNGGTAAAVIPVHLRTYLETDN